MIQEVDLSDLPPIRAYGLYTPAPPVKRGIPRGWWWLGALVISLVLWAAVLWGLYPMLKGSI